MRVIIETTVSSSPTWRLVGDDDHVIAWAGRTFVSLAYADQAAHDFRVSAEDPDYRVNSRAGGDWQWAAWRPEGVRVAVSGDWFASEQAARTAARRVRNQAWTAIGP
jgi:hypothetical protein